MAVEFWDVPASCNLRWCCSVDELFVVVGVARDSRIADANISAQQQHQSNVFIACDFVWFIDSCARHVCSIILSVDRQTALRISTLRDIKYANRYHRYYFIAARYDDRAASDVCGDWYASGGRYTRGSVQTSGGGGSLAAACLRGLGIFVLRAQTYARAEGGEALAVSCLCCLSG